PAGLDERTSDLTGFDACGSHGPSRRGACHTNRCTSFPTSWSVYVSHQRPSWRKTVPSSAATSLRIGASFSHREGKSTARYNPTSRDSWEIGSASCRERV